MSLDWEKGNGHGNWANGNSVEMNNGQKNGWGNEFGGSIEMPK